MFRKIEKGLKEIIMSKLGNISGNMDEDIIYLIGEKIDSGKNTLCKEIQIAISNGVDGKITYIDLEDIKGYNPRILLGEFRGIGINEILFTIEEDKEESGSRAIIYGLDNGRIIEIFDSSKYLPNKNYNIIYTDGFKVNLVDDNRNIDYVIDIKDREYGYLKEKYNKDGKLKNKCKGKLSPIYEILTVRSSNSDVLDLILKQKIIGEDINDVLGEIISFLRYDRDKYREVDMSVSISSSRNKSSNYRRELIDKKYDFSKVDFIEADYNPNLKIERAIEKEFSLKPNVDKLTYLYNRVKLKNTPKYQIMVYLEGPKFCSDRGGTLIILEEKNNEYVVTSKIKDIIPPIIISENINGEYNDLIVRLIKKDKYDFRVLKYNGNSYPMYPLNEEKLQVGIKVEGTAVISDDLFYRKGIEY
ncbi:hypothetical protein R0131_10540 [Clostridium sp. AL.422]|uniref:hypothetical protein n=1 Tax=Clostridium TaxID=1485 RepID=UPI00293DC4FF|nr:MULTISPECIES: hypothetical protein [unclassified Clostridium]MDV4151279.1 hypothetical protein [Clostridium sp. AL.422]